MSGEVDSDRDEGAECNGVCTRRGGKLATQLARGKNGCSKNKSPFEETSQTIRWKFNQRKKIQRYFADRTPFLHLAGII